MDLDHMNSCLQGGEASQALATHTASFGVFTPTQPNYTHVNVVDV